MKLKEIIPLSPIDKTGWPWNEETDPSVYDSSIQWPRITIVTPTYNQGQFIEETIRSILLQNYPNLEYIIMDGGSTDDTVEIIKKYEPWISYWVSEKDKGQSDAINKGSARATGEIFNWINSDDCLTKGALKLVAGRFLDPDTLSLCGYALVHLEGAAKSDSLFRTRLPGADLSTYLATCSFAQPQTSTAAVSTRADTGSRRGETANFTRAGFEKKLNAAPAGRSEWLIVAR